MVLKKLKGRFSSSKSKMMKNNIRRTESPTSVFSVQEQQQKQQQQESESPPAAEIVIVGAGIVGLVLALALKKHLNITPEVYEQANAFHDDVGAGMGMYPNGLRVIRDIDPNLLKEISEAGYPYMYRRWERHDGTEVAVAEEKVLAGEEDDLMSIGIRRWRLQKVLLQATEDAGIKIHFKKRLEGIKEVDEQHQQTVVQLRFSDGSTRRCKLLLAADGSNSQVRQIVTNAAAADKKQHDRPKLKYTGTQCLMGTSALPRTERGLSLPSSPTSKCHGAFYAVTETEQCFQFHFPVPEVDAKASQGSWGSLTEHVGHEECAALAERLVKDGWDPKYLEPLHHVNKAIKIGFSTLEPPLESFIQGQVALVGDAAHPPVPYLGQGAQQGLEDAGTIALLLKELCLQEEQAKDGNSSKASLCMANLETALELYDKMRVPRTQEMCENGKKWGASQQKRAENEKYNTMREKVIEREVFFHETMPVLLSGVHHDYKDDVAKALEEVCLGALAEGNEYDDYSC
eukprot:scaffold24105_cov127-Cylindrotheca_fusiformis.AAC.1